jgi:hypothetical protein
MTIPGGFIAGDVLTAASVNLLPAGVEGGGYAERTSDQGSITSVADLTSLTVTFTAVAGRRYRASVQCAVAQTVIDGQYFLMLKEGATVLQRFSRMNATTNESYTGHFSYCNNASISGSKTWKVTLERDSGTASLTATAAATRPNFILIEDIGEL